MEMSKMRAKLTDKLFHCFMKVNVHHRTGHTCDVRYAIFRGLLKVTESMFWRNHLSGFDKLIFYLKEITRILIFYCKNGIMVRKSRGKMSRLQCPVFVQF
jgi:hypothetical protein